MNRHKYTNTETEKHDIRSSSLQTIIMIKEGSNYFFTFILRLNWRASDKRALDLIWIGNLLISIWIMFWDQCLVKYLKWSVWSHSYTLWLCQTHLVYMKLYVECWDYRLLPAKDISQIRFVCPLFFLLELNLETIGVSYWWKLKRVSKQKGSSSCTCKTKMKAKLHSVIFYLWVRLIKSTLQTGAGWVLVLSFRE